MRQTTLNGGEVFIVWQVTFSGCVISGICFDSAWGIAGNTAGGWHHRVHHPPQPWGPVWRRGCWLGCCHPWVPLSSGTGQHHCKAFTHQEIFLFIVAYAWLFCPDCNWIWNGGESPKEGPWNYGEMSERCDRAHVGFPERLGATCAEQNVCQPRVKGDNCSKSQDTYLLQSFSRFPCSPGVLL